MSQLFSGKDILGFDSAFFQEIILSSGVFRRETASGFYPFGIAKRLFFMFLFLIPFTIRQQCRISIGLFH